MTSPIGKRVDKAPATAAKAANQSRARGEIRPSLSSKSQKRGRSHRGAFGLAGVSLIRHIFFNLVLPGGLGWGGWNGLLRQTFRQATVIGPLTGGVRELAFERLLIAAISGAMVDLSRGGAAGLTTIDSFLVAGRADKEYKAAIWGRTNALPENDVRINRQDGLNSVDGRDQRWDNQDWIKVLCFGNGASKV